MVTEEEITKQLNSLSKTIDWMAENEEKIKEKYAEKFIAVREDEIVESDEGYEKILNKLKNKEIPLGEVKIEYVFPKGEKLIL